MNARSQLTAKCLLKKGCAFWEGGIDGKILQGIKPPQLCKFSQNLTAKDNENQQKVVDWEKKKGVGMHRKWN